MIPAALMAAGMLGCVAELRASTPPTGIGLSPASVVEGAAGNIAVGILTAADADVADVHQFALVEGPGGDFNGWFWIWGSQLLVRPGAAIDYEAGQRVLSLRVRATDKAGLWHEQAISIQVINNPDEDVDGDGIAEAQELLNGTSDLAFDSDGDGVGDPAEIQAGTAGSDPLDWPRNGIVGWGDPCRGARLPPTGGGFVGLATAETHSLALRATGVVEAWGGLGTYGQTTVPAELNQVVAVSAGGDFWVEDTSHSLALRSDGTVVGWGYDLDSRLVVPADLAGVVAISSGRTHCLALKQDGTVVMWGYRPHEGSDMPAGLSDVVAVSAGGFHSLALKSNGTVVTWGSRFDGVTWGEASAPAGLSDVVAVEAGRFHSLALKSDGTVVAWGYNSHGQTDVPPGLTDVVAIAAGGFHSLALKSDGSVVAWGLNSHGQVDVPVSAQSGIRRISAGLFHSLAVREEQDFPAITSASRILGAPGVPLEHRITVAGAIPAGFAARGLPAGLEFDDLVPGLIKGTPVGPARQSARIEVVTTGGLLLTQSVWFGITEGSGPDSIVLTPPQVVENSRADSVVGVLAATDPDQADSHSFELVDGAGADDNGMFRIAGGQLILNQDVNRDFETNPAGYSIRVRARDDSLNPFEQVVAIATADDQSEDADGDGLTEAQEESLGTSDVSRDSDGDGFGDAFEVAHGSEPDDSADFPQGRVLVGWGNAGNGRIAAPAAVADWIEVAAGGSHSLALTSAGRVVAWGANGDGQATVPAGLSDVVCIAAGDSHSVAVKADGTVVGWGAGGLAQTTVPAGLAGVVAVAAGGNHIVALKGDGTVVAWGWGENAQLQSEVPAGLANVVAVAAGRMHSLALRDDGSVVAWGDAAAGATSVPEGLSGVVAVAAGGTHNVALRHDGSVVAWGDGTYGQTLVPAGLANVTAIAAGARHSVALLADGSLVAWGANDSFQSDLPPEAVAIRRISAGGEHNLALREDAGFPGIPPLPPLRSWPGEVVSLAVAVEQAEPTTFSAMGLPDGLAIDPALGVIGGPVVSGTARASRVTAETDQGRFSRTVWIDTASGVAATDVTLSPAVVVENSPAGTVIGLLTVTDPNSGDSHGFSIDYGLDTQDNFRFAIQGNQLVLFSRLTADFDLGVQVLHLRVTATDAGGNAFEKPLTVQVIDDRGEDADGDGFNEALEEDVLGTSDQQASDFQTADPDHDGVPSLIEHAFNMDPLVPGPPLRVVPGGASTAGLPAVSLIDEGAGNRRLRIEFVCRVGAGLTYTPQFSSGLGAGDWQAAGDPVSITPLGGVWERRVVEDTQAVSGAVRRFGRVAVSW